MEQRAAVAVRSSLRPCGLGRRCLVMLYDALIVVALLFIGGLVVLPLTGGDARFLRDPVFTVWIAGLWFAYLGWCWTHGGQTVGMRAWRVGICTVDGAAVGWRASAIRFSVSWLSTLALGAGFLWAWTNPDRAAWHDLASRTRLRRVTSRSDRAAKEEDDPNRQQ